MYFKPEEVKTMTIGVSDLEDENQFDKLKELFEINGSDHPREFSLHLPSTDINELVARLEESNAKKRTLDRSEEASIRAMITTAKKEGYAFVKFWVEE